MGGGTADMAGRTASGFDAGIDMALRALLTSPEFLFRIEQDPKAVAPGAAYRISDVELASRLSFFLWSSVPDEALLDAAERKQLSKPAVLEAQVRRMLADPKAEALTTNFASQWLYLRNLTAVEPNLRLYPDFDDNLRQAFRRETELFFQSIVSEGRGVLTLLDADYTFLNQRLATHYGIPNVYGDRFRRQPGAGQRAARTARSGQHTHGDVPLDAHLAGASRQMVLENIMGMPPPAPPPNVLRSRKVPIRNRRRCVSRWSSTGRTPRAPPAIATSIRWGLRWRTLTPSVAGGQSAKAERRSM
jgi:hypothetical protein